MDKWYFANVAFYENKSKNKNKVNAKAKEKSKQKQSEKIKQLTSKTGVN
jgi:hypothetical protein